MPIDDVTDPTVRALIDAMNTGDREGFFGLLTDDATLSDDGTERDLVAWVDREIFESNGRLEVESATSHGRSLIANYRNDTYGTMRTRWRFNVQNGRITRIEAGQA